MDVIFIVIIVLICLTFQNDTPIGDFYEAAVSSACHALLVLKRLKRSSENHTILLAIIPHTWKQNTKKHIY